MATLLHIDSSVHPAGASVSRAVTQAFRRTWQSRHPGARVIYRDLSVAPVAHLTTEAYAAGFVDPQNRTPGQVAAFAARQRLIEELERADAILLGAPMHNFTIPSTLKAWLDNVVLFGRTAGENSTLAGTPTTVVTSRGLSYAPCTPDEEHEHVQNYLTTVLGHAMRLDVGFIVPEFTQAMHDPSMASLVPLFEWSRNRALEEASARAQALGKRDAT
ncbi:FMN-dependent NADH-azoreductase [Streptomyces sp. SS1-1]|uniref:FMN-dependent NADH-azoreductase n=1 Tax=Streptomyces sp. SS1-1 TaxID=2651869 RepID=UPI00124FBA01|nr:NAD(P)H-dependent oxidoreductase [Streptomyces sp. SS1-1]KAB2977569.1 FMN-dependent NADH-azoreductase [Streptomyces sp. SS1-1]